MYCNVSYSFCEIMLNGTFHNVISLAAPWLHVATTSTNSSSTYVTIEGRSISFEFILCTFHYVSITTSIIDRSGISSFSYLPFKWLGGRFSKTTSFGELQYLNCITFDVMDNSIQLSNCLLGWDHDSKFFGDGHKKRLLWHVKMIGTINPRNAPAPSLRTTPYNHG